MECRFLFKIVFTFPSHICPEVGLMDHMVTIFNHPIVKPMCVCVCAQSLSHVWLFATPWNVAHQGPLSMEFSRHENEQVAISYSRGFLSPETDPMSLASLHWQADTLPLCHLGSPIVKPVLTSIVAALIYIPTNCAQGFLFLHSLTNTYCPPLLTSYITIVHLPKLRKPTSVHY